MNKRAVMQNMRYLENKALKNNWNYGDVEIYLDELGLYYTCEDMGDDYRYYSVINEDETREWVVTVIWQWTQEDIDYWEKQFAIDKDADFRLSLVEIEKSVVEIIVERTDYDC